MKEMLTREFIKKGLTVLVGVLCALVPFYYNTNSRLTSIEKGSVSPKEMEEIKISNAVILEKLISIEKSISNEQKEREKMYNRNEKMYDLFIKNR